MIVTDLPPIVGLVFTADGRVVAAGSSLVALWDPDAGTLVRSAQPPLPSVRAIARLEGGEVLLAGGNLLVVWDPETGAVVQRIEGRFGADRAEIRSLLVLDGRRVITGHEDGALRRWDLAAGRYERRKLSGHSRRIVALTRLPDGRIASGSWDHTVRVWKRDGTCTATLRVGHAVQSLATGPRGGRLLVGGALSGQIGLWDVDEAACVGEIRGHGYGVLDMAPTADGTRLVTAAGQDPRVRVFDLDTGERVEAFDGHAPWVYAVAVDEGCRRVVSAGTDGTVRAWPLALPPRRRVVRSGHADPVMAVAVAADAPMALTASVDRTLKQWDASGRFVATLRGHRDAVSAVAFVDGRHAVSGSYDGALRVWDLTSGTCLETLAEHGALVAAVVVLPDGRVVSADHLDEIRVWLVGSGKRSRRNAWPLPSHATPTLLEIRGMQLHPDRRRLVLHGSTSGVALYDVDTDRVSAHRALAAHALVPVLGGEQLLVATPRSLELLDPELHPLRSFPLAGVHAMASVPHRPWVALAGAEGLEVRDLTLDRVVMSAPTERAVTACAWVGDDRFLVGLADGSVRIVPSDR